MTTTLSDGWALAAEPREVRRVRRLVAEFARSASMPEGVISAIELSVSEAVSNAILHAFPVARTDAAITVSAQAGPTGVRIVVQDNGTGMRERDDSPGAGLGLGIMRSSATSVATHDGAPAGGHTLTMCFRPW